MRKFLVICMALVFMPPMLAASASAQLFYMENSNIGKPAPDFTLPATNGKEINLTEYRGDDKAIIFFWATWCPHCRTQLKELSAKSENILQQGIKLVIVDYGEDIATVAKYAKRNKIELDMIVDQGATLEEPYELIGVPTFFFVDSQGIVKAVEHELPGNLEEVF